MKKILFILKENQYSMSLVSNGLINSATPVSEHLHSIGYDCKVVHVIDGNFIDHVMHEYKPDIVVIEAIWVETAKLRELIHLWKYHHVQWIVRVHSNIGFFAAEPYSIKVLREYIALDEHSLVLSFTNKEFEKIISSVWDYKFTHLPNIVNIFDDKNHKTTEKDHIHIGCFGALRLIKNQCFQALCAMEAANRLGKKLYFHITPQLSDDDKDLILSGLKCIFQDSHHELVIHNWMPLPPFLALVKKMDFGLQLSFTESFNIVAADFVSCKKLIIVSDAISWMPTVMKVSATDYEEVINMIIHTYRYRNNFILKAMQSNHLQDYNTGAEEVWDEFMLSQHGHHH